MHRIDGPGFALGNLFTEGNPSSGIPATVVTDDWLNDIQENVAEVIEAANIALVKGNYFQLLAALNALYVPINGINGYAQLGVAQTFTKAQRGAVVNLVSAAGSIAVDLALANNYKHTLTENTVLAAPSNAVEGQSGYLFLQQHATVAKTLAYNTFWKFPGGLVPSLTATLNAIDVLVYSVDPGGASATCQLLKDRK